MDKENTRSTITFMVIAALVLIAYQVFFLQPQEKHRLAEQRAHAALAAQTHTPDAAPPGSPVLVSRAEAVARSPRTPIDTPALQGSLSLRGARLDDLFLKDYRETLAKGSPPVELFRPEGAKQAYFADFGWTGAPGLPDAKTMWTKSAGDVLAPGKPVTLSFDNGQGLAFTRTVAVDDQYMFTVTDAVGNTGAAPVKLAPYASVQRQGEPQPTLGIFEGATGTVLDGSGKPILQNITFKKMKADGTHAFDTSGGWYGLTDKYWMAALAPSQAKVRAQYRATNVGGVEVFETNYVGQPIELAPGAQATETRHLFAGAKKDAVLEHYEKALGLAHFSDAIDWGRLWFLTRPIFWLLSKFSILTGSVGIAILLLTIVRVTLTFPLYNKSFASTAEMKKLAPEIEEIKKRFPDDAAKQQQETMALYKARKVNPLAGCVPALIPIPIFLALSKVFTIAIELRHAPFGFVHDLSAPDPTTFVNLFGLLPFDPATIPTIGGFLAGPLHIGIIAILYGCAQWLVQAMSPQTAAIDPTQRQIFQLMPIVFTFFMARFAAGLLIYWTWSSFLTLVQQYVIMHRHKTENPIDSFLARVRGRSPAAV